MINSTKYFDIKAINQSLDLMFAMHCPFSMHYQSVILCPVCMFDIWLNSAQKKALTEIFIQLGKTPTRITEHQMVVLEASILDVYGSRASTLAAARYDSFNKSANNDLCSLPPSKDALHQHLLRACYQAGYLWQQCLEEIDIPDPGEWGWKLNPDRELFQPL